MMDPNLIKIAFIFNSLTMVISGVLVNFFEQYLPLSVSKVFRYGKFSANFKDAFFDKLQVPKRWFKHFYAFASPFSSVTLVLLYYRYCWNAKLPNALITWLKFLLGKSTPLIPIENTMLAMTIFTVHCWKRFYETHYISVYSDVYMNIMVYIVGFVHYFGSVISIFGETQNITKDQYIFWSWKTLTWLDYTCTIIFLLSTYLQYRSNIILSNLRKDKKGAVVTKKYKIPQGELFNYVSAPLQLTEIILYLCLSIILKNASTFHFVTLWVICNQMECAILTHEWFLRTFKNYPKSRKIILPFIF